MAEHVEASALQYMVLIANSHAVLTAKNVSLEKQYATLKKEHALLKAEHNSLKAEHNSLKATTL